MQVSLATVTTETGEVISGALKRAAEGMSSSLCKELRILMLLQGHRNVLEVLAWASDGQQATAMLTKRYPFRLRDAVSWYKMQFLRGSDDELQPLVPLRVLWPLILSLAHAFMFLQQHDIVHRDVKPENIMLDDDGQPVIIDFGSAVQKRRGKVMTLPVGTPSYLAPEVAACVTKPVAIDTSMDAYSFAMVIAEATIGFPPRKLREMPPTSEDEDAVEDFIPYDDDLRWLVSATLSVDPEERPDIRSWVTTATAACARLKCGGRSALRPLFNAAASWAAEQEAEGAPASTDADSMVYDDTGRSAGAPADTAPALDAAPMLTTSRSGDAAARDTSLSETSAAASCKHESLATAAPAMLLTPASAAAARVDTADAAAASATCEASLHCSDSDAAQSLPDTFEPMPSLAAMMPAPEPLPDTPAGQQLHHDGGSTDADTAAAAAVEVAPLPRHLSAVATPRVSLADLADDLELVSWTPAGRSSTSVPSLLGHSPVSSGSPDSPWLYADSPCASPLLLSPRPTCLHLSAADTDGAPGEECGTLGEGVKDLGAREAPDLPQEMLGAALQPQAEGECDVVNGVLRGVSSSCVAMYNAGTWPNAGPDTEGATMGYCGSSDGGAMGVMGGEVRESPLEVLDAELLPGAEGEFVELTEALQGVSSSCIAAVDAGTQTEGHGRTRPRWCGWLLTAGAVGLVAAKAVCHRR